MEIRAIAGSFLAGCKFNKDGVVSHVKVLRKISQFFVFVISILFLSNHNDLIMAGQLEIGVLRKVF